MKKKKTVDFDYTQFKPNSVKIPITFFFNAIARILIEKIPFR